MNIANVKKNYSISVISFSGDKLGTPAQKRLNFILSAIDLLPFYCQVNIFCLNENRDLQIENHDNRQFYRFPKVFNGESKKTTCANFLIFALYCILNFKKCNLIYASSGRIGTAVLAALLKIFFAEKLFLELREDFPKNVSEVIHKSLIFPMRCLERHTLKFADHVNLISPLFQTSYKKNYPHIEFSHIPHAITPTKRNNSSRTKPKRKKPSLPSVVLYAGNAGMGQLLHELLPSLAQRTENSHVFHLYLKGNLRNLIEQRIKINNLSNIKIFDYLAPEKILEKYSEVDVLLINLANYEFAKRVLPSKIFDYSVSDTPILIGAKGNCKKFITTNVSGCYVFSPNDIDEAYHQLKSISQRTKIDRRKFREKYSFTNMTNLMAGLIQKTITKSRTDDS